MNYAPNGWSPDTLTIQNGRATKGADAAMVDKYTTWLAASNPWPIPTMAGSPLTQTNAPSATPTRFNIWIPAYCEHIAIRMLCTGQGTVYFVPTCDAWTVQIPVTVEDGGAGTFALSEVVESDTPQTGPDANSKNRAINNDTVQSKPKLVEVQVSVTDATGKTLRVWQLQFIPLLPLETAALVA